MKVIPSIAFGEFSGSAGDVTARSIGGRTILNHKAYQAKTKTPAQAVSRNTLSKVSRAYKQLTDSQMKAWGALAEHLKGISTFGKAAEMTAHNAFVRINANREIAGEGMLADAPEYKSDIPEVDWDEIWVTPKRVLLTGIVNPTGTYKLVVKMSAGQGVGISSGWSKTVIVTPGMVDNWGDAALTQLYTKKIGFMPEVGEKVFIELYWLDPATGFVGETMRVTRFCISEEEAHEEGLVDRVEYTLENVSPESHVSKLDIDLTTGAPAISFDTVCLGHSNVASSEVYPEDGVPTSMEGYSYLLARGAGGNKITAQSFQVQFVGSYNPRIIFAHRGGYYVKPSEVFGTGVYYK
ncbi:MAG: hypothetical protein Q4F39_04850 [Bacteroidia bacterium]|nr:hypothetical protein [Bacteroidia bacterium]